MGFVKKEPHIRRESRETSSCCYSSQETIPIAPVYWAQRCKDALHNAAYSDSSDLYFSYLLMQKDTLRRR